MNCKECGHSNAYRSSRSYEKIGLRHFIVSRRFCLKCDFVMKYNRKNDIFPYKDHKRDLLGHPTHCAECSSRWPCDMALLADELSTANVRICELEMAAGVASSL
jgi:hypothetical protein